MAVISGQQSVRNSSQLTSTPKLAVNKVVNSNYIIPSFVDSLAARYYNQSNVSQGLIKLKATAYIHGYSHDYLASLVRFFGEGFKQDANYFHINKAALPGLTPHPNNTAEELLTGLLLRVKDYESNNLISSVAISSWKIEYTTKNNINYKNKILLIHLYPLYESGFLNNADKQIVPSDFK